MISALPRLLPSQRGGIVRLEYNLWALNLEPGVQRRFRLETQHKTAQLEASLGIMPATEGMCRACGKPLQVGAEFCAYCAAPVVARPKVCVCATMALPDAKWCPKRRAALPA